MNIKPIHTEKDYKAALKAVAPVFERDPDPGSDEGDWLEIMVTLIENYESKHYPIEAPTPVEAIKFRMEQGGLKPTDLKAVFGTSSRFYEVISGKRNLTLAMISKLHHNFGIPAESLLAKPQSR
ncbi:transcriptional regulator [Erwinia sp. OLTSP20]|uniref:helix-turn-helix domain-containing protein n=1 Tax=unclassified Erwinia TaxID=2622719 RepID=UPI000C17F98B|nr:MULTISPECIES: transcriptional regulator [unclassified Erwinia]PIJ52138.1 transcriptional regulator [Erwinia sp. OAMSP11]PIJ73098.1 transcriptional regulator [Erwinia sp. OLSSP12]PIJ84666.1 transcriptional regulator [Erwinia sp. OLCASP19]PIJ87313.1 transcriptional regulator [Erwinia sp. OLMTSP26]PIJ87532.1 transcriptional regulator [Erwinia sp. OLMDSP33]